MKMPLVAGLLSDILAYINLLWVYDQSWSVSKGSMNFVLTARLVLDSPPLKGISK
jgi:hypothetical protein